LLNILVQTTMISLNLFVLWMLVNWCFQS